MKGKVRRCVGVFVLLFVLLMGTVWAQNVTLEDMKRGYVAGEILVKFKPEVSDENIEQVIKQYNLKKLRYFQLINVFHFKTKGDIFKIIKALKKTGLILYAEPNYIYKANVEPNDPRWDELWGLAKIQMPKAWDITTGRDIVIADIDTGIDYYHEDLRNNLWVNPGEDIDHDGIAEMSDLNGVDDDGNGYVDDLIGWNFVNDTNNPYDKTTIFNPGHGTHTAGTIGAVGNNGIGVVGVNWHVKIMALKFLNKYGSGSTADAIRAIEYYTMMGIKISNNSWGGGSYSQSLYDAIMASKSLFVAAAGNDGRNNDRTPSYPASYNLENIVAVAATDSNDQLAWFSNYGVKSVDLASPGVDILSTLPGDDYGKLDGTSMATPHVTGVAGLLLAYNSDFTPKELKWYLLKGTDYCGLSVLSRGRLNASKSLELAKQTPVVTVTITPLGSTTVQRGDTASYKMTLQNNTDQTVDVSVMIYAVLPNGKEKVLQKFEQTLSPSQTFTQSYEVAVPINVPLGSYLLVGQAQTANSFDEYPVNYEITQ